MNNNLVDQSSDILIEAATQKSQIIGDMFKNKELVKQLLLSDSSLKQQVEKYKSNSSTIDKVSISSYLNCLKDWFAGYYEDYLNRKAFQDCRLKLIHIYRTRNYKLMSEYYQEMKILGLLRKSKKIKESYISYNYFAEMAIEFLKANGIDDIKIDDKKTKVTKNTHIGDNSSLNTAKKTKCSSKIVQIELIDGSFKEASEDKLKALYFHKRIIGTDHCAESIIIEKELIAVESANYPDFKQVEEILLKNDGFKEYSIIIYNNIKNTNKIDVYRKINSGIVFLRSLKGTCLESMFVRFKEGKKRFDEINSLINYCDVSLTK